jgi:hypothetical protein
MSASMRPTRLPSARQRNGQVDGDRGFAHAALAGADGDDCLHPTPRGKNYVRISQSNFRWINHAILSLARVGQLGKKNIATGDFDQLFDPPNAADQGIFPLLKKHAGAPRKTLCGFGNGAQAALKLLDQRFALTLSSHERGNDADHVQDLRDAALVEIQYGDAAQNELPRNLRLHVRERQHQVRLQIQNGFEIGALECGDARLAAGFRRTHRIT